MRWQNLALAVAFLLSLVTPNAWGSVQYTVTDLGLGYWGGVNNFSGLNNNGQVVGTADGRAFLYSASGGIQDFNTLVAPPQPGWTLTPNAINDNGQIVGLANGIPFLYNDPLSG